MDEHDFDLPWAAGPNQYDGGVAGGDDDWVIFANKGGIVARDLAREDAERIIEVMNAGTIANFLELTAAMYQAAGAFNMPVRFLDVLSLAANSEPFAHLLEGLLPVNNDEPGVWTDSEPVAYHPATTEMLERGSEATGYDLSQAQVAKVWEAMEDFRVMRALEPDPGAVKDESEDAVLRKRFEDAAFNQRFISSIKKVGDGPFALQPVGCPPKDEFVKRGENGDYIEEGLNYAWWAWKARGKDMKK